MIMYDFCMNPVLRFMFKAVSFSYGIKNTKCYLFNHQLNFQPEQMGESRFFSAVALMKLFHSS